MKENRVSSFASSSAGLQCLLAIARYFDREYSENRITKAAFGKSGHFSLLQLAVVSEKVGFRSRIDSLTYKEFTRIIDQPCIFELEGKYTVVFRKKYNLGSRILLLDGDGEPRKISKRKLSDIWCKGEKTEKNQILILEPGLNFFERSKSKDEGLSWKGIAHYFQKNRTQVIQVLISLGIASAIQMIFPFLIQSIIDVGVNSQDLDYIIVVLILQLSLVICKAVVEFVRGQLLLHISTRVNLSIISDFWIKLTRLPISYFEQNQVGDTLQRINDNKQVQNFLTGPLLSTLYSLISFIVFAVVLITYKSELFLIFLGGVILYIAWTVIFLKIRRKLNYLIFSSSSKENDSTLQMINGMHEIKLQGMELPLRWDWENVQAKIFNLNFRMLTINQLQQAGVVLINQSKDVLLIFVMAKLVINGELTLGSMLALEYVIIQLSWPVEQFIGIIPAMQEAKISMERLNEVHNIKDEELPNKEYSLEVPHDKDLVLKNISFKYQKGSEQCVLKDVNLSITAGKITAIVGSSGSGKTTLLKLLLKFYDNYEGSIKIGDFDLADTLPSHWRSKCASVMQESFIFNDTIANNIEVDFDQTDMERLVYACETANILSFINSLPDGFDTRLGVGGISTSQGQRQRLLIARAVYKQPQFLFLDESTNALDSNNEKIIVENLRNFFNGRTVVIVAHRLSTIRNADKIIVLNDGEITEEGTHDELLRLQGKYHELIKGQL